MSNIQYGKEEYYSVNLNCNNDLCWICLNSNPMIAG